MGLWYLQSNYEENWNCHPWWIQWYPAPDLSKGTLILCAGWSNWLSILFSTHFSARPELLCLYIYLFISITNCSKDFPVAIRKYKGFLDCLCVTSRGHYFIVKSCHRIVSCHPHQRTSDNKNNYTIQFSSMLRTEYVVDAALQSGPRDSNQFPEIVQVRRNLPCSFVYVPYMIAQAFWY